VVTAEARQIRTTTLSLQNRSDLSAVVFVRHAVPKGWTLRPSKVPTERLGQSTLFRVEVPAKKAVELSVEESQPLTKTVDIRTSAGADSLGLYLKRTKSLSPELRARLDAVLALYRDMADVQQRLETLDGQMREYRTRVDELNVQLVTLRNVRTASELSRHLAKKMQEISDRLQKATIEATDLRENLMTRRIRIQDAIAELTLEQSPNSGVASGEERLQAPAGPGA
jgi:hypothetical protein